MNKSKGIMVASLTLRITFHPNTKELWSFLDVLSLQDGIAS
jgi:hypothetical protein